MDAHPPLAVNDVVRRRRAPPSVDVEGITQAQVGHVDELIGDVALVRWMVSDQTGTQWHPELALVPVADLEATDAAE